ncbi:phage/plasmid primase, P4 family [Bradyrhizobium sp. DN5]|uniref:DNA primase family protein n=1 Tax=Bradyrhizobium sp. DN5 TaxID=3056950 RepID=UPI003523ED4D
MIKRDDVNDTLRNDGVGAVRERYDNAKNYRSKRENERSEPPQAHMLPPPGMPMAVAREFIERCGRSDDGELTIRHWRGGWWIWRTLYWQETDDRAMRALLYKFTENAFYPAAGGPADWAPNRHRIGDLVEALSAVAFLAADINQPTWLDGRETGTIVATANGLLDVERRRLYPHSPLFFNQTAVPFDYAPTAPPPNKWLAFLAEVWPDEPAAVDALSEWYGYVLSGRLDLHKILLMVGPTRGGKGVIARILSALVGERNVAGPTLSSLGGEFGLAPLLGKTLAVISDARFVGKNSNVVVERLLSISGEDSLTVNRKYRDQWTGKLPCRLHIVSNELPKLGDASAAIVGRIVLLMLSRSWLGKEDHGLEVALLDELPGILNWALAGLHRLTVTNRNRFTRVSTADEAIAAMRDLASPVAAFVRERCEIGKPEFEIEVGRLYVDYKNWAEHNGHPKPTKQVFARDLRAAFPAIRMKRPRTEEEKRVRFYVGIKLKQD